MALNESLEMVQHEQQLKEVALYATSKGYDLASLTPSLMEDILEGWLAQNETFYKCIEEAPVEAQMELLGFDI